MRHINPAKTALSVGIVLGLYHVIWAALVATNTARPVMDFVLSLHFIQLSYQLAPFSLTTAAVLVCVTFAVGALFGFVFATVWNWLAVPNATSKPAGGAISPAE